LLTLLLLGGCSGVQSPLNPAGDQAHSVASLLGLMTWICGGMYLLVIGFLSASIWRARASARSAPDARPRVEPADTGLGRGLIFWGGVILAGLTVLIVASFLVDRSLAGARTREALVVRVTAHQWWWRLQYRNPATGAWIETANELHLPAGRTARIELGSADVIHSFWVPNVAGKMDVVPGRVNVMDVTPRREGWFRGQCAEFCGTQHAHMAFDVKVDSPVSFDVWLAGQATPATAPADATLQRGLEIVSTGPCAACHVVRGTAASGRAGPDLTHIGSRRSIAAGTLPLSRGALQGWIAQPQAIKPGTLMPAVALEPRDADAVARYLETLK
jgi:cytochrome c oxidase subunit 2